MFQLPTDPAEDPTDSIEELMRNLNFVTDEDLDHLKKCMDDVMAAAQRIEVGHLQDNVQSAHEAIENIKATRRETA